MRTVVIYDDNYKPWKRVRSHMGDQLVKAYKVIGYHAFVLPRSLDNQAA